MSKSFIFNRILILICFVSLVLLLDGPACYAAPKTDSSHAMTVIELQSELMGYADRFGMIMFQAFDDFDATAPNPAARKFVLGDMVYTMSSVYTIAALPNPEAALLDMIVVTTLGRMIYEQRIHAKFGMSITEIIKGFKKVETDIWNIAQRVLSLEQQQELRSAIINWVKSNPNQLQFFYIRFSELGVSRSESTLVKSDKSGGLFKSVQEASQEIEETRMLAERGIYLATRLPLLSGLFTEFWTSQLIANPDVGKILVDLHTFSKVSERMAAVAEKLPQQIAKERRNMITQVVKEANTWSDATLDKVMDRVAVQREAMINQFMNRLADERHNTLQELLAEEQRVKGLVAELRQTIGAGNNLMLSTTTLAEKIGLDQPSARPFDIQDYRDTIAEASKTTSELSTLVDKINLMVNSEGIEQLLPQITKAITKVGDEGEQIVDRTFRQTLILILIWLVGYVLVRLILQRLSIK